MSELKDEYNLHRPPHLIARQVILDLEIIAMESGHAIKFGQRSHGCIERLVLQYQNKLSEAAPAAPALDSQAELTALRAERDALIAALREARDSLLDIRDISEPYDTRDNPPGYELSRIFSHAEYGLRHSEAAANKHGMEKGDKP